MFSSNTSQVSADQLFIEDLFSTYLYQGNNSTQTITNGIDLSTKGGLVWMKDRTFANSHQLYDTARGVQKRLMSDSTSAQGTETTGITAFNSNGWTMGAQYEINDSASRYASWTFRKQAKFFDVVTWTGNGSNPRNISHNLGSTPGCIIAKNYSSADSWYVYHRSLGGTRFLVLNSTDEATTFSTVWANTNPTSTQFTVGATLNSNGVTYVAYLFAHNAGGFGLTGTDNVISCGSFSGSTTVNLGWEPQWLLYKRSDGTSNWFLIDNMRGFTVDVSNDVQANTANAEGTTTGATITSTGFKTTLTGTYIYIAIRRGPMKTPTSGTSVFNPVARTGTGTNPTVVTTNNNPDLLMSFPRTASPAAYGMCFWDKLRGISPMLQSASTNAETNTNTTRVLQGWLNTGYQAGADFIEGYLNYSGSDYINYPITRAPGFFDEVCYTGTGAATTVSHNLGVAPELIIVKSRSNAALSWNVYAAPLGNTSSVRLNADLAAFGGYWNSTSPTASVFSLGSAQQVNENLSTFVAYLFASCPGVSKVGSYTGNGSSQTINCGFTGGARFVMVKRTDSTGNWMVVDTARGLVSASDPTLYLNSTAAEVTGVDWLDPDNSGFIVNQESTMNANVNGATYIYLSIA